MPKGLRRFHHTGDWHFITCSCYRRQKFLDSVRRRDLFLEILEEVMPEHFSSAGWRAARQEVVSGDAGAEAACLPEAEEEEKRGPDGTLG